jgi:ArsR family transcriptional regulator
MEELIKAFKALSDETSAQDTQSPDTPDCCVCEVMQALDISQTRASRNLQILYEAGMLRHWKEGLWSHYGIVEERRIPDVQALIHIVRQALQNDTQVAEILPGSQRLCRYMRGILPRYQ